MQPMFRAEFADPERFERTGVAADAHNAALTRDEFARWLRRFFDLDPFRSSDLVLALNEALANTAEYAYRSVERRGTMDVQAHYDPMSAMLTVCVVDRGTWRTPDPAPRTNRGRGIPLMKALADRAEIDVSDDGTHVSLAWGGVRPR